MNNFSIDIKKDILNYRTYKVNYGTKEWKELQLEALEELSSLIDKINQIEVIQEDEQKYFKILDDLNGIYVYMLDGLNEGYEAEC